MTFSDCAHGVTVDINGSLLSTNTVTDMVTLGSTAGVKPWLRAQVNMAAMQSGPGQPIDFTIYDDAVAKANGAGLPICLTVQNPAPASCTNCGAHTPFVQIPVAADVIAFWEALLLRYNGLNGHGQIQASEINEDYDAFPGGFPGDTNFYCRDPQPAIQIYQAIFPYAQTNNPGCQIGSPALLGKRTNAAHIGGWVNSWFLNGGGGLCNYFVLHFYNCAADPDQPNNNGNGDPSLPDRLNAMKLAMIQHGYANVPVHLNEAGYPTNSNGSEPAQCIVTPAQQSAKMLKLLQICQASGIVSHVFTYTIDKGTTQFSLTQGNGGNRTYNQFFTDWQNTIPAQSAPFPITQIGGVTTHIQAGSGITALHGGEGKTSLHESDGKTKLRQ